MKSNNTIPAQIFFNTAISPEAFAVIMRKFLHASVMLNFNDVNKNYQEEVKNGYFWLSQFCEEIDPNNNLKTQ